MNKYIISLTGMCCVAFSLQSVATEEFLTGDWGGTRSNLSERGIDPFVTYTGEVLSNLDGGNETGTIFSGILDYGVDLDLEKLIGLPGGTIHVHGQWIDGEDGSENYVGDANVFSNIAEYDTNRLFQLWYQQEFNDGAFVFRTGLIDLDDDFMASEYSGLFINSGFGPMPSQSLNNPAPIWPLGALGAWFYIEPKENRFLQFGVYDGDSGDVEENHDGFLIENDSGEGLMYMLEAGIEADVRGHPGVYKLGAFYHSGDFMDFSTGGMDEGQYGIYFVIDQEIGKGEGVWWRLGYGPQDEVNVVRWHTDFGFNKTGLFSSRPDDILGVGFIHTEFADDYLETVPGNSSGESVIEITYQIPVRPWFVVQPDLQFILDPHEGQSDALVFGVRAEVSF